MVAISQLLQLSHLHECYVSGVDVWNDVKIDTFICVCVCLPVTMTLGLQLAGVVAC